VVPNSLLCLKYFNRRHKITLNKIELTNTYTEIYYLIGTIVPTAVGAIMAYLAIQQYSKGQELKRKEVLFTLSEEFNNESMKDAKLILDDYVIKYEKEWKKPIISYDIQWYDIYSDYRPLKNLLKDQGFCWVENQDFVKNDKNSVVISDKDHFLSIIDSDKLPSCVDERSLDKIILQDSKIKYRYLYYLYADITDKKVVQLGYYYHKSNLKYILRNHLEIPIMDKGEAQIRQSFDSVLKFIEKLGYLLEDDRLIGDEELSFFATYVKKAHASEAVNEYIRLYNFNLVTPGLAS